MNSFFGELRRADHSVIPRTIFTDPQVATVGLTEAEAQARGHRRTCSSVPMALVPRASAVRDTGGVIKMVLDADTRRVVGVSMVGRDAGDALSFFKDPGRLSCCVE